MQELQIQLEKMKIEKITHDHDRENLLSVIDKLKEDMEGMRGQDRSEMQRLQQVVWELQQENAALKSRQEHQQQVELVVVFILRNEHYYQGSSDLIFFSVKY